MEFTSQICTTKEQSERLLALGLKKETADCIQCEVRTLSRDNPIQWHLLPEYIDKYDEKHIPAWSLHRLMEMCPLISNPPRFLAITSFKTVYVKMNNKMDMCYAGKGTYNNLIDCIEWLIQERYFNKEYLEDQICGKH